MSDGAEETGDDVEGCSQIESGHITEVKTHVGMFLAGLPQHPRVGVQSLDLVMLLEISYVVASSTGHVE